MTNNNDRNNGNHNKTQMFVLFRAIMGASKLVHNIK